MIPGKTKSFCNLVVVQCTLHFIAGSCWGLPAFVCSRWWYRQPQPTKLHLVPSLHSPARWLPLKKAKRNPSLQVASHRAAISSSSKMGQAVTRGLSLQNALLLFPFVFPCLEVHAVDRTRVTDIPPCEVSLRTKLLLLSASFPKGSEPFWPLMTQTWSVLQT